ncbi:MAG TPA: hypothetical protein VIU61_12450 [Kofleriaceae bacterium]
MKHFIIWIAVAVVSLPAAFANEAPPTPQQLEAAKKAYADGKKLHEQGKLPEAIEKFKESYRLSKKPALLYNIAITMEEAGMDDLALFYFRKYLTDAPDGDQRANAAEHVKTLEKKFGGGNATKPPEPDKPEPDKPVASKTKPAGTYTSADFQHEAVDAAPPGKPLDVTASVPEDSGFVVTLNYRVAGEDKFTQKTMKRRYKELVARVPAAKMSGSSLQYFVEVKDTTGAVIAKSGKATSPNLVNIEAGVSPRFYPDFTDDGEAKPASAPTASGSLPSSNEDDDDPLNPNKKSAPKQTAALDVQPPEVGGPGRGFRDVGSSKFTYAKWGSTIGAGTMLGLSVLFYVQAGNFAKALEEEATGCGTPPCAKYDDYNAGLEASGKNRQMLSRVTLGVGVAAAAVAGYFWYKELTAKKRGEMKVSGKAPNPEASASWLVAPMLEQDFVGAVTATRF